MNNKSIRERLNSIKDKGPDRWLSRDLFEDEENVWRFERHAGGEELRV